MKRDVFPRPEVVALLREFVPLKLYVDMVPIYSIPHEERARLAKINQDRLRRLDPAGRNPLYLVLSPRGEVIETSSGYQKAPVFTQFLRTALAKFPETVKVAEASGSARPASGDLGLGQK